MKGLNYILWDNDGVLVNTEKWYFEATRRALSEISVDLDFQKYMGIMQSGKSAWSIPQEYGIPEKDILSARKKRDSYYQHYLVTEDIEIPNVEKTLEELSKDYSMAIVTTSKRRDFDLIHQKKNITKYMDFILSREDYEKSKPNPEPYLKALRRFNAKKDETIVIEDSARGLKSAISAGIDCIIIQNEFTKTHDFSGAKIILNSIDELPYYLNSKKS